jgi:3D (Asp-Asp-Asp) domain-containing protein
MDGFNPMTCGGLELAGNFQDISRRWQMINDDGFPESFFRRKFTARGCHSVVMNPSQTIRRFRVSILMPLASACLLFSAAPIVASEDATLWTSVDGVSIRARLAGWDGRRVFLVKNGRHFVVPLERLSVECVAKAKRMLETPAEIPSSMAARHRPSNPPVGVASPRPPSCGKQRPLHLPRDRHGMAVYPSEAITRIVRTTAYSCGESDHLSYGSLSAYGTPLRYSDRLRSAAADWSVYPVGTRFRIKGQPWLYVVDDYGSALVGTGTIDIYHPTLEGMRSWGRRNVEITIVRWGCQATSARILAGRTRHDHCRRMFDAISRRVDASGRIASR